MRTVAVVIGRNEGQRLVRCFEALRGKVSHIVYVDSGSSDDSVDEARARDIEVIELDLSTPFTAARARNAGMAVLDEDVDYVQTIDGDCELHPDWIACGVAYLDSNPKAAGVSGRLRERHPEATIWNRLADDEWEAPSGETRAVGGIALLRRAAIVQAGGYREELIAGEEPEMCLRVRRFGWTFWRLSDEMAWHDIDMTRFGQWWRRMKRSGHAYAEGAVLHGAAPERYRVPENRRILLWGACLPLAALLGGFFVSRWALLLLLLLPLQVLRLTLRGTPLHRAFFLTLGKFPEAQGVVGYWLKRLTGKQAKLIEYK